MTEYTLEKRIWTDKDFDQMGWHDCHVYQMRLGEDLEIDIDYILHWNKPELEGLPFTFWIAPATLVFEKVQSLTFDFDTGPYQPFDIENISMEETVAGKRWTIITQQGDFQFFSRGFKQYIRQDPSFEFEQIVGYHRGASLERTTDQDNPYRFSKEELDRREKNMQHYGNAKKRHLKRQEFEQLNEARENGQIGTKEYLLKKKEISDIIFSYDFFLKGTLFESW